MRKYESGVTQRRERGKLRRSAWRERKIKGKEEILSQIQKKERERVCM